MSVRVDFCGIDGSGKSTASVFFSDYLRSLGKTCFLGREVGNYGCAAACAMRNIALSGVYNVSDVTREFLCMAMRVEQQSQIEEIAENTDVLVFDRGLLCHYAYGLATIKEMAMLRLIRAAASYAPQPDYTVLMTTPLDVAWARVTKRGTTDAVEGKGPVFQTEVQRNYLECRNLLKGPVFVVDASGTRAETEEKLRLVADEIASKVK